MLTPAQRWQYPARVGPVQEVALPTLDWLVQHPDPTRRPVELVGEQYSFPRIREVSEIPIDWLVQHPDPVLPLPVPPSESILVEFGVPAPPLLATDFLVQHPEPPLPLPLPQQPPALVLQGEPIIPSYAWFVQDPEIVWAVAVPQQPDSVVFPGEPIIPAYDWWSQEPELVWAVAVPQQPDPLTFQPEPIIPAYDWFVQATDVMRRVPPVLEGASVLVEFHIPVPPTVPDIDFIVQHPDPLPKPPPIQTEPELAFEHEDLIPPPDWLVQHPEPVQPREPLVPEAFAFEFEHELLAPSIDWLQQLPDPIQELRRPPTQPAAPELTEVPPPAVVFDWLVQHPDPVLPEQPRQDWYVRVDEMVEIPVETWLQPPSEPVRLPIQLVRFHGELFLVEFAVPPGVGIPYVFRMCQALWEIIHPSSWESAVAPSGYIPPPEYVPVPSGYIAVEGGTAPWDMVR